MTTLNMLQDRIGAWGLATFPKATEASILAHLRDEVGTDDHDGELHPGCDMSELADAVILLIHLAAKRGESLEEAVLAKFAIIQQREYATEPNEKGFFQHTKKAPSEQPVETDTYRPPEDTP